MQTLVPPLPDGAHATGRELPAQPVPPADTGIGLSHGHILTSSTAGISRETTLPSREVPTAPHRASRAQACRTTPTDPPRRSASEVDGVSGAWAMTCDLGVQPVQD